MAARLRRISAKNNSPDVALFRRYFVTAACHTQSVAARLRPALLYTFSATRSLALRARGLCANSSSPDTMGFRLTSFSFGFLPHTHTGNSGGQMQPVASSLHYRQYAFGFFQIC